MSFPRVFYIDFSFTNLLIGFAEVFNIRCKSPLEDLLVYRVLINSYYVYYNFSFVHHISQSLTNCNYALCYYFQQLDAQRSQEAASTVRPVG